jgi:hypothetical protein
MNHRWATCLALCLVFAAAAGALAQETDQPKVTCIVEPAPDTAIPQGGVLYVSAEVHVPGWVRTVTLEVDQKPVSSRRWSPYVFRWDTTRADVGRHVLRVKVLDLDGKETSCEAIHVNVGPRAWELPAPPPGEALPDATWRRLLELSEGVDADLRLRHDRMGLVDNLPNQPVVGDNPLSGAVDPRAPLLTGAYTGACAYWYATLHDRQAQARAKDAHEAIHMLSAATGVSGLLCRWFRQTTVPQRDESQAGLTRWHQNGAWRWLGDAGTEDYAGAFFGHALYYDLVADSEEKRFVAEDVASMANRILEDGLLITSLDRLPVPDGDLSPERLSHPVNAVLALGFLKIAHHMTGQQKFEDHYRRLITAHGYAQKQVKPHDISTDEWGPYHDFAAMLMYCCLLEYEKDPELLDAYRKGLDAVYTSYFKAAKESELDQRPLFDVIYKRFYPETDAQKQAVEGLLNSRSPLGDSEWLLADWMGRYYQVIR